jgi:DNA polymerase
MSFGFFDDSNYVQNRPVSTIKQCGKCKLYQTCITPKMKPSGEGKKGIFILAEAPGKTEDERGTQLVGQAGKRLKYSLKKFGIDLHKDCRKYNSVNCRPPKNATPTDSQIDSCRPDVIKEIKRFKPKLIIALGSVAIKSLLGHRWHKDVGGINKWRGFTFPDFENNCWFSSSFHPSFIERDKQGNAAELIFHQDLKNILSYLNKPLPQEENLKEKIKILYDPSETKKVLKRIIKKKPPLLAFDYETTGLKPNARGHKAVCCSVCYEQDRAYSFMMDDEIIPIFKELVTNPFIGKIASNMKFEHIWTKTLLKVDVASWIWDTMLAAHCLDNRPDITSLKFQALIHWGIWDYDSHIAPLLEATGDSGNAPNQIHLIDPDDLLEYCGIDSLLERRLAFLQMKTMGILDPEHFAKTKRMGEGNIHESFLNENRKADRKKSLIKNTKQKGT